jgi:hypothetical protein
VYLNNRKEMIMKVHKSVLNKIIKEEIRLVIEAQTERERRDNNTTQKRKKRKQDELRWGDESLRQLASGIVGEDNFFRDKNGYFTSAKDAATYSSYFIDGVRKNLKGATKSVKDSGRGETRKGSGKYRLKNGTAKYEGQKNDEEREGFIMSLDDLASVVEDCIGEFINGVKRRLSGDKAFHNEEEDKLTSLCRKKGYRTYNELLRAMNSLALAGKGDLTD